MSEQRDNMAVGKSKPIFTMAISYLASGGSLIVASAAQLVTFAILARWLGVDEFSLFVAITAIANIAVHLCGLGAMECLVRRVAQDPEIYAKMLGHNIILTAISGILLIAIGALVLPFFFVLSANPLVNFATITLMLTTNILLVRIIVLAEQIYIAHSKFPSANKVVVSFALARTTAASLACFVFSISTVAEWAVWQFATHVLVALSCVYALKRLGKPKFTIMREELPQGAYFSIPFILRAARQNVDLLVLSLVSSAEIVSSYSVARRILESSYLSVEALNRLIYPGSAKAASQGLHNAVQRVRKVFIAAALIASAAAVAVFVLAPLLPLLFGDEYTSLISFTRILCWIVVPIAIWSVAVEALGASGHQAVRGSVMASGSLFGAALAAFATWYAPPTGAFVSFYTIELCMIIAAWSAFSMVVRRDREHAPITTS